MRRTKLRDTVALFAAIFIGCCRELAPVHVFMAGNALRLRNPKQRVLAFRDMTLFAFDFRMTALERIHARGMFLDAKRGGLESVQRVTNSTISTTGARQELAPVVVGMAIGALRKRDRRLEISLVVAVAASYGAVFSEKRISRLGVIEALELRDLLPVRCVVAGLACAFERAFVGIGVTAGTRGEG
jgi:hypothetical protein